MTVPLMTLWVCSKRSRQTGYEGSGWSQWRGQGVMVMNEQTDWQSLLPSHATGGAVEQLASILCDVCWGKRSSYGLPPRCWWVISISIKRAMDQTDILKIIYEKDWTEDSSYNEESTCVFRLLKPGVICQHHAGSLRSTGTIANFWQIYSRGYQNSYGLFSSAIMMLCWQTNY